MNLFEPLTSVFRFIFEGFYDITAMAGIANYGIAIILMTILVKVLLYPLTAKQVRSMKAMQELQPALKKLQKDYKNNPFKIIIKKYSKENLNLVQRIKRRIKRYLKT